MNTRNPSNKGAVEAAFQCISSQNPREFRVAPPTMNHRVSTCHDSVTLGYDQFVQIVVKAVVDANQAF